MLQRGYSSNSVIILLTFFTLTVFLDVVPCAHAQVSGAAMTGTVLDSSGAVIPNARISIKNISTGEVRESTADASGFYSALNLLPGGYEITVTAPGFSTEVRRGVTLTVGTQQVLNITMNIGQVAEKIEVTSEAPSVELAKLDHQWCCHRQRRCRVAAERTGLDPTRDSPTWSDFDPVDTGSSEY